MDPRVPLQTSSVNQDLIGSIARTITTEQPTLTRVVVVDTGLPPLADRGPARGRTRVTHESIEQPLAN